jgi:hypothetical protein
MTWPKSLELCATASLIFWGKEGYETCEIYSSKETKFIGSPETQTFRWWRTLAQAPAQCWSKSWAT